MARNEFSKKKFSIATLLVAVLVLFSIIGTFTMIFLSRSYSESALHSLANDIIKRTVYDSTEHVSTIIKPAVSAVGVLESQIPEAAAIINDKKKNDSIVHSMIKTLQDQKGVYTIYYANELGEFFLVGKRQRFEDDKKVYYFHKRITVRDGVRRVTETWYDDFGELDTVVLGNDIYNPKVRPWYNKAKVSGTKIWTDPYIFFITKLPGITYAKPIYYNGVFSGVVASDLEINTISKFMMDSVFTKNTSIFAVDNSNHVIAHSNFINRYADKLVLKDKIPDISSFEDGVMKEMVWRYIPDVESVVTDLKVDRNRYKSMIIPINVYGLNLKLGMYTPANDYLQPLNERYRALFILAVILLMIVVIVSRYISRQLAKPFKELSEATERAKDLDFDKQINIHTGFKEVSLTQNNFNEMLESLKNYQSANELLSETLHNAHIDTLYRLAMAAEHKDQYTYDHLKRVSDISVHIADVLGMSNRDMELIRHASAMHDVGKLGIPDNILMKPGKLTVDEFDVIKTHSLLGSKILENPSSEEMHASQVIALSHHEKWDGSGYPQKLSCEDIPLNGRIVALADVTDALLSKRPYKEPFTFDHTMEIIEFERGKHFDPELVDLVLENKKTIHKLVI